MRSAASFDAGTGPLLRIDIRGCDGVTLNEHWESAAATHLGMMTTGFPNLFLLDGPQCPCAFFSPFLLADSQCRRIASILEETRARGVATVGPAPEAEAAWTEHIAEVAGATLLASSGHQAVRPDQGRRLAAQRWVGVRAGARRGNRLRRPSAPAGVRSSTLR